MRLFVVWHFWADSVGADFILIVQSYEQRCFSNIRSGWIDEKVRERRGWIGWLPNQGNQPYLASLRENTPPERYTCIHSNIVSREHRVFFDDNLEWTVKYRKPRSRSWTTSSIARFA